MYLHSYRALGLRRSIVAATLLIAFVPAVSRAQTGAASTQERLITGHNVSMAGGTQVLEVSPFQVRGDVLGRAQNEPSCGISTRNPQHILCGANDYRMVDVPGVTTTQIIRDAWLGNFQSRDGGDTWESTLHPGYFLDPAVHPLKRLGLRAAADPTVRTGLAGMAWYSGIAFIPDETRSRSAFFVSTYADTNNRENDPLPFKFVRTAIVQQVEAPRFIDKPWIFVEAAPAGQMCTVVIPSEDDGAGTPRWASNWWTQLAEKWLGKRWPGWNPRASTVERVPASIIHAVYSVFIDPSDTQSELMYTRSDNCGLTFSKPVRLNVGIGSSQEGTQPANGATVAKSLTPGTRRVFTAWRQVAGTSSTGTFTNAIMGAVSDDNGATWSKPALIADACPFDQGTTKDSFRTTAFPTLTVDSDGRAYVAWSDRGRTTAGSCSTTGSARIAIASSVDGRTWSVARGVVPSATPEHQIQPSIAFTAGRLLMAWIDFGEDRSGVFGPFVDEAAARLNRPAIRHTADVRAAMALPGVVPDFASDVAKVSEYLQGVGVSGGRRIAGQMQWNAVNKRWARKGTVPFNGDYIDIATMPYLPPDPTVGRIAWTPNTSATMQTTSGAVPVTPTVLIAWADNRDMRSGPGTDNPDSPVPYVTPAGLNLPPASIFDPGQPRVSCVVPSDVYKTGTTNQNTYAARATAGVIASSPGNNKTLGTLQRAFVVYVRNDSQTVKTFSLTASQPTGGTASFDQFDTTQRVLNPLYVPPNSSAARTVFVTPSYSGATLDPHATVRVDVVEVVGTTPVQATAIYLNGDASAPEIDSPEIDSREVYSPEIDSVQVTSQTLLSPEIDSPEIDSPEIDSATWLALGLQAPEIDSPEIDSPEIDSPEIDSPEIDSPQTSGAAITDATFQVTNTGNTTAQYNARAFVRPVPGGDFRYQVIVRRKYSLAAVDANCQPTTVTLSKVAVNLVNVTPSSPEIDSPEIDSAGVDTASFYLAPGESADVIVRARSSSGATLQRDSFELAAQPVAVNSDDAAQGVTEPPVVTTYLSIATATLPSGSVGTPYSAQLLASGATGAVVWSVVNGTLPDGLTLSQAGLISGTPTTEQTSQFTIQAIDSAVPPQTAARDLSIAVITPGVATLVFVSQPVNTLAGQPITPAVSVRAFSSTGTVVPGASVNISLLGAATLNGTLTRQTGSTGVAVFSDLVVPALATGLRLQASVPGFASAVSAEFSTVLPDLVVDSLTHTPIGVVPGDTVTVTAVVRNIGSGRSNMTVLMLQLPGETAGADETLIGVPSLTPGESFTVQRLSAAVGAGSYTVNAVADYLAQTPELSEANNAASDPFTVGAPDLTVQTLTHAPASPTTGDVISFTATVSNVGSASAGASTLMFAIGGETQGAAQTLFAVPALAPGATYQVQRQMTFSIAQGYTNTAIADYQSEVAEGDELNNTTIDNYIVAAAPPVSSGLVSWWEAQDSAVDSAGSNDGTLMNGAAYAAGRVGRAFSFDGVDDYIEIPHDATLNITNALTVGAWVYPTAFGGGFFIDAIVSKESPGQEPFVLNLNNGRLEFAGRHSVASGGDFLILDADNALTLNVWHHVAATFDGTTVRLYVNGVEVKAAAFPGTLVTNTIPLAIGNAPFTGDERHFNGLIDEVMLFNRALTATEMQTIFDAVPTAVSDTATVVSGSSLLIPVLNNDRSTSTLTVTSVTPPAHGAASPVGTAVSYLPTPGFRGVDGFTYTVTDSHGNTDTASIEVSVTNGPGLLFSEVRMGPGNDEFVELFNNSDSPLTIGTSDGSAGWTVVVAHTDGSFYQLMTIPNGTVIPARGHYVGTEYYNIGVYNPTGLFGDFTFPDVTWGYFDGYGIPADSALALFSTADSLHFTTPYKLDAVGFSNIANAQYREGAGLPPVGNTSAQYSFVRRMVGFAAQDTDDNAADFVLVEPAGSAVNGVPSVLGIPGLENRNSTVSGTLPASSPILIGPFDVASPARGGLNEVRTGSTLTLRRKLTNASAQSISTIRFRVVGLSTMGDRDEADADLRLTSSSTEVVSVGGIPQTVYGATLDNWSNPGGGGLNSDVTVALPAALAPGQSVNVQFSFVVAIDGKYRVDFDTSLFP